MLGLRKSFGGGKKLKKRSSTSSSLNSLSDNNSITEDTPSSAGREAMETIRAGLKESMSAMTVPTKYVKEQQPAVTILPVDSSSDSEQTVSITEDLRSSTTTMVSRTQKSTVSYTSNRLTNIYRTIRKTIFQLDDYTYNDAYFERITIDSYRQYVSNERLIRMPRRGSNWDRALRSALMFGENLVEFGDAIQGFCADTEEASITGLASCKILLEIDNNSKALAPTFQALNELALLVGQVIQIEGISNASKEVKHAAADLYCDLVRLVGDIAVFYRKQIGGLVHGQGSVNIKFDVHFGKQMTHIWGHKAEIVRRMWELKLGKDGDGVDTIRRKLNGRHAVASSFYSNVSNSMTRAEDTCEWLKSYLVEFFRSQDKVFTITGPAGSGKTVLARWVRERLQRPIADEEYFTLFYSFPFDSPEDATTLAFLKNVLFQLLERNVGDVHLYEKLVASFTEYSKTRDAQKLEASLWTALDVGLRTIDDHGRQLVIIADGLEEVSGSSPLDFHKKLRTHTAKFDSIRAITFSKPISHISEGCKHLIMTQKYLADDIRCFVRQALLQDGAFSSLNAASQDKVLEELTAKAKDSFLWANLAVSLLSKATTSESLLKVAQSLTSDLSDVINKLVAKLQLTTGPTKRLLSSMLVAHRPLTVHEISDLLRVNLEKRQLGPAIDVLHQFSHLVENLAVLRDGTAHFKSKSVRDQILTLMGKSLPSSSEAQTQFTMSLLLYAKLKLDMGCEPSFEDLGYGVVDECFDSHPLLEYATQYWIVHFRSSGMCGKGDTVTLSGDFKEVFPDSALFVQLERSCWRDNVGHYELALKVREGCFHDKGISVLQSLIILGNLHLSSDAVCGAKYFYRAANCSQIVLSRTSTITMICTNKFLQVTETMTFTTRTELVTWRITIIEFMIEVTKKSKGQHCHEVIRWYELLATLYVSIHEHHNATLTYKLIYEIIVIIEGKHSPRARKIADTFGGLDITLKGVEGKDGGKELEGFLLDTCDGIDVYGATSIEIRLRLALVYIAQKKWVLAEEIFISLWRSISIACRIQATWELHIAKIRVAIEYIRFLRELKRIEEALSILTIVWTEYEHFSCETITVILRIRELGELFKCFGMFDVAITILGKVWGWFKSHGKCDHPDAVSTTVLITEVVEEIMTTTTKTKTTVTTTTEVTETITKEIFETHYHRCKGGKVDDSFFRSCFALIKLYQCVENWVQAEIIITRTLELTWKAILSADISIKLCEHHVTECIRIATSLAICYHRQRMFEKAEHIYLRMFRACWGSLDLDHHCCHDTLTILITFYEEHHRHEKVIEIYIEVLARYRKVYGHGHAKTIEILYLLAGHCRMLGRKDEFTYYIEIVTVLNKGLKHCHHDARRAAVLLIEYYYEHKCWKELQDICTVLWTTFCHHHTVCRFEEHEIEVLYKRYLYVLEFHAKIEFSVLYKLAKEYHTHVRVVFGFGAAIIIKALIAFGGICERDAKHHDECVKTYEEVITRTTTTKTTTTTVTETEVTTVKTRLSHIYVTIITTGAGGKTTTDTFERCIQLCLEVYAHLKLQFGCHHEKTLGKLLEIIIIYKKINTAETRTKMITILQTAFIEIITSSISSLILYTAATTLATIYVTAELVSYAEKLIADVQHLIIFGNAFVTRELTLKIDVKLTKVAFVFLTAFKQRLVTKTIYTFSEVMASLLLEMSLYEQYTVILASSASIETILLHGAKLRFFWTESRCDHLVLTLDAKLFALFKNRFSAFVSHSDDVVVKEFYLSLLIHLGSGSRSTDFASLACAAGNARVASLLEKGEFKRALQVARVVFTFCEKQRFYHDVKRVAYGYKLAEMLAGIDVRKPTDGKLVEEMLKTSREIMAVVLAVFREDGVDFVRLQFKDLAGIVRLLGAQGNFKELEPILHTLWHSREVRDWDPARVLSIGRLLVHTYTANHKLHQATDLASRLAYNLQRSKGHLHPEALEMSQLLAALYSASNRPDKAMSVYEDVLRQIDSACSHAGSVGGLPRSSGRLSGLFRRSMSHKTVLHHHESGETGAADPKVLAAAASLQFELMKRAFARQGAWNKPVKEFVDLHGRLTERLGKSGGLSVAGPESWKAGDAGKDGLGVYAPPKEWRLDVGEEVKKVQPAPSQGWVCGEGPGGMMSAGVPVKNREPVKVY